MYNDLAKIHIGQQIDNRIKECGLSYAEFARRLNVERTTVYNIIRSKSIDIDRLLRISDILGYDFLRAVYLNEAPPSQTYIDIPPEMLGQLMEKKQIVIRLQSDEGETPTQA